ncbi:MAG TPA: uracil-DNA glycosylase [Myxococcales bacterium]|jgi:uracil-DNA glycosylase family 4
MPSKRQALEALRAEVISCRQCPRLVACREKAAKEPPRRFVGQRYWARPLPGFGDPDARIVVVGLAPAAHGGNRTGRFFTGDQSGVWLFRALFQAGLANQALSESADDGLTLLGAYVTAAVRCAPPANKPTPAEKRRCLPYFVRELEILRPTVLVALGSFAWGVCLSARGALGRELPKPRPKFGHLAEARFPEGTTLVGSYHPSQQNTFTGKLTEPMLRAVFERARSLAAAT